MGNIGINKVKFKAGINKRTICSLLELHCLWCHDW